MSPVFQTSWIILSFIFIIRMTSYLISVSLGTLSPAPSLKIPGYFYYFGSPLVTPSPPLPLNFWALPIFRAFAFCLLNMTLLLPFSTSPTPALLWVAGFPKDEEKIEVVSHQSLQHYFCAKNSSDIPSRERCVEISQRHWLPLLTSMQHVYVCPLLPSCCPLSPGLGCCLPLDATSWVGAHSVLLSSLTMSHLPKASRDLLLINETTYSTSEFVIPDRLYLPYFSSLFSFSIF